MKPSEFRINGWYQSASGIFGQWTGAVDHRGYRPLMRQGVFVFSCTRDDDFRECCEHGRGLDETCLVCNRLIGSTYKFHPVAKALREMTVGAERRMIEEQAGRDARYDREWAQLDVLRTLGITTTDQLRERVAPVQLWTCEGCAFTFDAAHTDEGGGYSCPVCAEHKLRERVMELEAHLECVTSHYRCVPEEVVRWWSHADERGVKLPDHAARDVVRNGSGVISEERYVFRNGQRTTVLVETKGAGIAAKLPPVQRGAIVRCDNGWDD